jgi:hypothetical protein
VADRFLPREYLIGPEWFPIYRFTLRVVLLILAGVILFVVAPIKVATDAVTFRAIAEAVVELWQTSVYAIGLLTLFFAALDHFQVRFSFLERWRRRPAPVSVSARPIPRPQPLSSVVLWSLFVGWWVASARFPVLIFGPADSHLGFSAGWRVFHTPILLLALATLVHRLVNLARPQWSWPLLAGRTILNGTAAVVLALFARTYPLVVTTGGSKGSAYYEYLAQFFNASILFGTLLWTWPWILATAGVYAWQCLRPQIRRIRGRPVVTVSLSI